MFFGLEEEWITPCNLLRDMENFSE